MSSNNALLVSEDNVAATSHYYPSSDGLEMDMHTVATVGIVVAGGVTVTVEACMRRINQAADAALSDTWVDITGAFTDLNSGSGAAAVVDTNAILQANGLCVERIRVKAVASDTSNSVDLWLRRM